MRVVIQVVNSSSVAFNDDVRSIGRGFNILVGIENTDTVDDVLKVAKKVSNLRIFSDADGKLNLSIKDVDGEILSISQFTLLADCKKGNRPSFLKSAKFDHGQELYELFNQKLRSAEINVVEGFYGEHMIVKIENYGPTTIIIDSSELSR